MLTPYGLWFRYSRTPKADLRVDVHGSAPSCTGEGLLPPDHEISPLCRYCRVPAGFNKPRRGERERPQGRGHRLLAPEREETIVLPPRGKTRPSQLPSARRAPGLESLKEQWGSQRQRGEWIVATKFREPKGQARDSKSPSAGENADLRRRHPAIWRGVAECLADR